MFGLEIVLGVEDVKAAPLPLVRILLFVLLDRVHKGFHALGVAGLIFLKIHQVKPVSEAYIYN